MIIVLGLLVKLFIWQNGLLVKEFASFFYFYMANGLLVKRFAG
jgi:hypothetical protein